MLLPTLAACALLFNGWLAVLLASGRHRGLAGCGAAAFWLGVVLVLGLPVVRSFDLARSRCQTAAVVSAHAAAIDARCGRGLGVAEYQVRARCVRAQRAALVWLHEHGALD